MVRLEGLVQYRKLGQLSGIMRAMVPFRRGDKGSSVGDRRIQHDSDAFSWFLSHLVNNNYVPSPETDAESAKVNKMWLYT